MNNELIKRIDYSPSMSEGEVEILLLDCKAEIELLKAENESLRNQNTALDEALEAKPVGEAVKVEYYLPEYYEWTRYLSDVAEYKKTFGTPEGGLKKRTLYTAPPSIDALIAQAIESYINKTTLIKSVNLRTQAQPYLDELIAEIDLLKIKEYEISVHPWIESAYELYEVKEILDKYRGTK